MGNARVAILGAAGRMGRMLIAEAAGTDGVVLAAAIEREGHPAIGQDAGIVAGLGRELGVEVSAPEPAEADVFVDFTFHSAVPGNLALALRSGARGYILATTGLDDAENGAVAEAAKALAIVRAANMSLGVNLLEELVRRAAAKLDDSYDIEIVEMHHRHKKDAPSGTALALAREAAAGRGISLDAAAIYGRSGLSSGERPRGEIAIHALRGGEVVGDHAVVFAGEHERIELAHKAQSRAAFAKGAMTAARWLPGVKPGVYSMRDVLFGEG